jgi:hypothetical protein
MATDSLPAAEPPHSLRWFQHRLRSLFVLTLQVANYTLFPQTFFRRQQKWKP